MEKLFTLDRLQRISRKLLVNKNFFLLWISILLSQVGDWIQLTAQSWLVLEISDSAFAVSAVAASGTIPQLLFVLLGGVAADRYQKKRVLRIIVTVQLFISVLFSIFVIIHWDKVLSVLLFTFLLGICTALWRPVYLSYIPQLVPQKRVGKAMGLSLIALYVARTLGPPLAGLSISTFGVRKTFIFNPISFLFPLIALWLIKPSETSTTNQAAGQGRKITFNLEPLRDPILLPLWILNLGLSLLVLPVFALLPVFARDVLHADAAGLGVLMGASGVGQVLGALMSTLQGDTDHRYYGLSQILGYIFLGFQVIFFSLSTSFTFSMIFLAIFNFLHGFLSPRVNTIVQLHAPPLLRGTVQSLFLLVFGLVPLGQILLGWLSTLIPPSRAVLLSSVLFTIFAVTTLIVAQKFRRMAFFRGKVLLE